MSENKTELIESVNGANQVLAYADNDAKSLLPRGIDIEKFRAVALECVRKTPAILKCTKRSFLKAYKAAAKCGLEIDGLLGSGYLVPYGNEVQFLPGYKGYLQLCRRSGEVARISDGVVYRCDEFDWALGDEPFVRHKPLAESAEEISDENITHIYVVVKLTNGEKLINVWPVARVRNHMQKFSKSWRWAEKGNPQKGGGKKDSTWHQHFSKMAVKTVMIDLLSSGKVPISLEVQEFATVDRNIDMGIGYTHEIDQEQKPKVVQSMDDLASTMAQVSSDEPEDVIDGECEVIESKPEATPGTQNARNEAAQKQRQQLARDRQTKASVPVGAPSNYEGEDLETPFQ